MKLLFVVFGVLAGGLASASDFSVPWFTVDGGGGASANADGRFSVSGTVGQPDAGALASTDGPFRLNGGFWYTEVVFCGCTLSITYGAGNVTISWPCDLNGCVLEYADEFHGPPSPMVWTPVSPQPSGHSYSVPITGGQRYFRLRSAP